MRAPGTVCGLSTRWSHWLGVGAIGLVDFVTFTFTQCAVRSGSGKAGGSFHCFKEWAGEGWRVFSRRLVGLFTIVHGWPAGCCSHVYFCFVISLESFIKVRPPRKVQRLSVLPGVVLSHPRVDGCVPHELEMPV